MKRTGYKRDDCFALSVRLRFKRTKWSWVRWAMFALSIALKLLPYLF